MQKFDEFVSLIVNVSMCSALGNHRDAVAEGIKAMYALDELHLYGPLVEEEWKTIRHKLAQLVIASGGMVRMLTTDEVKELAARPNVRQVAVVNFLSSMPGNVIYTDTLKNLEADTRSYGWNSETYRAIREGIHKAYGNSGVW